MVGFYSISTIVGYLMINPLYAYIINIYALVWLDFIYNKYICFSLVGFYCISTIVGYLMINPLYAYIINIYALVWLDFIVYQQL